MLTFLVVVRMSQVCTDSVECDQIYQFTKWESAMKGFRTMKWSLVWLTAAILFAPLANANVGVPMIGITLMGMLIALVPVIAVEAYVLFAKIGTTAWESVGTAGVANVVSTIIGIPITWVALVILQMILGGGTAFDIRTTRGKILAVTVQAPWLFPYEDELDWILPAALIVLFVPFFFASWTIEYHIEIWLLNTIPSETIDDAVFLGNFVSYLLMGGAVLSLWAYAERKALSRYVGRVASELSNKIASLTVTKWFEDLRLSKDTGGQRWRLTSCVVTWGSALTAIVLLIMLPFL